MCSKYKRQVRFSLCSPQKVPLFSMFFFSDLRKPLFPLKCHFLILNDNSAAHCPAWKKYVPFLTVFCSSIGTKSTSKRSLPLPPPTTTGEQMYCPVWRTLTAYHPPATLCPHFFLCVSIPFYEVVRICRQTAAKLRMQGYHTCTMFYVSKLWYIRACKRIYAANKMQKFRHICIPHWKLRIW